MPSANQSESLRDSTDFETQLYLCNEAFKVWTLTPFNSSQTSYKIPCIHKSNFEAETCQNISLENTLVGTNNLNIPPSVARLANLPPTLLVLRLACLPPLRPHSHLRPPPWHYSKVENAQNSSHYGRSFPNHARFQWRNAFPGAEWCTTSDHAEESEPSKDERRRGEFLVLTQTNNFGSSISSIALIAQSKSKEGEKEGKRDLGLLSSLASRPDLCFHIGATF